jgi:hypothetical protein
MASFSYLRRIDRLSYAAAFLDQWALEFDVSGHYFIIITGRVLEDARDFVTQGTFNRAEGRCVDTGGRFEVHAMMLL